MTDSRTSGGPGPGGGGQARLLVAGSLAQQIAQASGLLAMFVVITVLARRLSLAQLGVYGLLTSLAGYLLVIQNAAANAAVRGMAAAQTADERARTFSTAAAVFTVTGLATGALVAGMGIALSLGVDLAPSVEDQAVHGALLLGGVSAVGWPLTIFRDALRASQAFVLAAVMDVVALVAYAIAMLLLVVADASLAVLIGASGSIPLFAGIFSYVAVRARRLPFYFSAASVSRREARELGGLAGYISAVEAAGVVIYALDRAVLGLFKSASVVGLFEGPVRAHNLVRALNGALGVTALPTAAKYIAERDDRRLRELVLRGTRYSLMIVLPLTVTGMVLAGPILEAWLGERYGEGGPTMTILLGYWLVTGGVGVGVAVVIAAGKARAVAGYAWAVAVANLALTLALVPALGLEGAALGTTVPYLAVFPFQLRLIQSVCDITLSELARVAWAPAYGLAVVLAACLALARLVLPLDALWQVGLVAGAAPLAYWSAYYMLCFRADERALVHDVVRGLLKPV